MVEIGQEIADLLDSEAAAALRSSAMLNGFTLTYAGWNGQGNTPAVLISAYAGRLGESDRKLILKISPTGRRNLEPRAHRDALAASPPKFRAAHLVGQPWDTIVLPGGGWVMFQEIADGRFDRIRPLSTLLARPDDGLDEAARACAAVVDSLLSEWNLAARGRMPFPTVRQYLSELLGDRLGQDGTVRRWAESAGVLSGGRPVGGQENPFTLLLGDSAASAKPLYLRVGNTHGDLHPGNILIPPDPAGFRLVDLSRFAPDRALTFDPVYLLLTVVAHFLPTFSPAERESVATLLVDPAAGPGGVPHGARAVLTAITGTASGWADKTGCGEEWRRESLLTTIGLALVMTGRDIVAEPDREWFYRLAALATAHYLDLPAALPLPGRPEQAHAVRTPGPEPDGTYPVATAVLPAGTPLWRVHPRSAPVDEFVPAPAGRLSALYVSRRQVTALLDELLREVAFDDDGNRVLAAERLAGMRLSALRTTRELVVVCADGEPDLVGLWPLDGTHGVEWPSPRDVPESCLLLVAGRCPPGTVRPADDQAIDLDDPDNLGWLRASLRPYRVRVGE